MKPPFTIYHAGVEIGDQEGHICTAENPEIAQQIIAALNAQFPVSQNAAPPPTRSTVDGCLEE